MSSFVDQLDLFFRTLSDFAKVLSPLFAGLGVAVVLIISVARQLGLAKSGDKRAGARVDEIEKKLAVLSEDVLSIQELVKSKSQVALDEQTKQDLQARATAFLQSVTNEKIEQDLVAKFGRSASNERLLESQLKEALAVADGVKDQILSQRTNANVNLFIGLIFAFGGLLAMGYVFLEGLSNLDRPENSISSLLQFCVHFVPRFGFVVLVESVAFFFLNLYREDRALIKFLRNELTNIELRFAALFSAVRFADQVALKEVIASLAKTERNFTVKKNERVMSDIVAEETSIMFERFFDKFALLLAKQRK
ncbi:hypothetical protein NML43_04110 [Rhodopseudomonas palustris]|uniref:hypothetical protein n=1 Tax=Rhodopseudomonas palustris TaxID=1076 RepID=UPI0020CBEB9D|nr:hypothetical protein [Rhodopseudomonas palustris]MCP9626271.1 hypothetical protein [Rhodopseudomonas palustris]